MFTLFEPVEPRKAKSLTPEQTLILDQIYEHWPRGKMKLTSRVLENLANDCAGPLKKLTLEQAIIKIKAVYKLKKKGKWSPLEWRVKHTGDVNMRDKHGQTILERACERKEIDKVKELIHLPNIVTDRAIASMTMWPEIQSQMIHIQVRERYLLSSSVGNSQQDPLVSEKCGEYSINQGEVGICYIVSVITLFRNEKSLLGFLKRKTRQTRPKPLREIITLLDDDYSHIDFKTTCPSLPKSMRVATTGNDFGPEQMTKNGGSAYTLMMYIMNTVDIMSEASILQRFYKIDKNKSPLDAMIQSQRAFDTRKHTFAYVDIHCDVDLTASLLDHIDLMASPENTGFIFRVVTPSGSINHVIAGCFCDGDLHICNSWGGGCVNKTEDIVRELTESGMRPLRVKNICFFLSGGGGVNV